MLAFLRVRLLAPLLLAVAALLALPVDQASAAPPLIEQFHDTGSFEIGPCPGGVTLVETFTEDTQVTTFFDASGTPVRIQIHLDYVGVVTNPVTGQRVNDPAHSTRTIDLIDNTRTLVGEFYSTTVPGVGVVFHDVGRIVRGPDGSITFEAGPHDVLQSGDVALFCAALGA
jgi:hypothetical protein